MAAKLGVAPSYFTSFFNGQGAGAGSYVDYAVDLDTNFAVIKTSFNDMVDEINSINGTNFLVSFDSVQFSDTDDGLFNFQGQGVLGGHSYEVTINGGDTTQVIVQKGQAIAQAQRAKSDLVVNLTGFGGATTFFIAIDGLGTPSLNASAGLQVLDIASAVWNGTIFTSVTQLAHIFWDGDEYTRMRYRPDDSGIWDTGGAPALANHKAFRVFADRVQALERMLTGRPTEADGTTLPQIGFGGNAPLPGIIPTDGATVRDTSTGFFRVTLNTVGFSASAVERLRFDAAGLTVISGKILNLAGTAALPSYTFAGDPDTGVFSIGGTDRLGFATAGNQAAEFDALGNLDLTLQTRGEATALNFDLPTSTSLSSITLDAEVRDVGASFAPPSADITIPTDGDGTYLVCLEVDFDEANSDGTPGAGNREIAIEFNGAQRGRVFQPATNATRTTLSTTFEADLTAGQIIRARAAQDSGGVDMNVDARITWRKSA